jgi:hypothetical protein
MNFSRNLEFITVIVTVVTSNLLHVCQLIYMRDKHPTLWWTVITFFIVSVALCISFGLLRHSNYASWLAFTIQSLAMIHAIFVKVTPTFSLYEPGNIANELSI